MIVAMIGKAILKMAGIYVILEGDDLTITIKLKGAILMEKTFDLLKDGIGKGVIK